MKTKTLSEIVAEKTATLPKKQTSKTSEQINAVTLKGQKLNAVIDRIAGEIAKIQISRKRPFILAEDKGINGIFHKGLKFTDANGEPKVSGKEGFYYVVVRKNGTLIKANAEDIVKGLSNSEGYKLNRWVIR